MSENTGLTCDELAEPTAGAFTLSVTLPDGAAIIAPMVPTESTGIYSATYTTTMAGEHVVRRVRR